MDIIVIHGGGGRSTPPCNPNPDQGEFKMNEMDYGHMKLRMHSAFDAAADRRNNGSDSYAENVRLGYLLSRDRYSQADALAFRISSEVGSGRSRVEANSPASSQTAGG